MKCFLGHVALILMLAILIFSGCSGGAGIAPAPVEEPAKQADEQTGTTGIWGMFEVGVDVNAGKVELTRLREADLALNVLGFMEPPALVNMTIDFDTLQIVEEENYIGVDVILKHPFVTEEHVFNGFDVKGIVFGPWLGNADGLTRYFNPNEFTGTPFGYQDGLLGAPDAFAGYSQEFNGYKYFANGIDITETVAEYYADPDNLANRGMFSEGGQIKRHYDLYFGGTGFSDFFVFNYAIFASYNWPDGDPPFSLEDFDVSTANQADPVFADVVETANNLYFNPDTSVGGGGITLDVTIFDWDKPLNPETLSIMAPGVINPTAATFVSDDDANRRTYHVVATGVPLTSADLDIIISATTEKTYGQCYFLDLMPSSHPLFDEPIEAQFLYKAAVAETGTGSWPIIDPMDTTTAAGWTVENTSYHTAGMEWGQAGTEWQANGAGGVSMNYQDYMETYLVSPVYTVPASGQFSVLLTHKYSTESCCDDGNIYVRYEGQAWNPTPINPARFADLSAGFPATYLTETFQVNLTPDENFQIGFCFYSDYSVVYPGWFIDHMVLTENRAPIVGDVTGESDVSAYGVETYSVSASDPDSDNLTYAWEIGDDIPAAYDDGPGNGDGTIDIDWQANGTSTVDCKVTDDGEPSLTTYSPNPLQVTVFVTPNNTGPYEDFDTWPPSGWTFTDYSTYLTGSYWGQTNAMSVNCLDADATGGSCYGTYWFEEARWNNVVIPNSSNAILKLTHTIWAEGYDTSLYCYDGGMLFIDDTLITSADFLSGYENSRYIYSSYSWCGNSYLPTWPGDTSYYVWSYKYPDDTTWMNGFATTIMDISSYADGGPHDIGLIFHADGSVSCEGGSNYHTWLIDKVEIFYD